MNTLQEASLFLKSLINDFLNFLIDPMKYDKLKLLNRINHIDCITFLCSLFLIRDGE